MTDLQARVQDALASTYTLERELGGGGMSRVFLAQERRLGRPVVVKLLSPELAAALSTTRFEREIQVAASLQQANIVPVLTAGEVDGLPYYTMPYVEGESLRARLARGPLAISEVVSILRDVSRALAYAHDHGVVHRDIKPDNVLLSGHTAVVTDFGIAKAIAAAAQGESGATITQLGTAVGTPMYMAPEQAAGDPATDHRADIYAFGCMAYELIASRPPFPDLSLHKLLVAHMSEMPKPVAELRPDCPPALAALVTQCLAKAPETRPGSAAELLNRLDAVASPSGATPAMPGILLGGRNMLWRALAIYAAAFVAVAILARAAIIAIGLPDWVFPGALVVMALGLPVVLFTAYTQLVTRRAAAATPTYTPGGTRALKAGQGTMATLAIKASPHFSWKRTARGGIIAVGAFVLLIVGYLVTRALGIGPAGSLLASGKLSSTDRVVVSAFDAGTDLSLGSTIAEAVRTNLAQSNAVHIMPTSDVVATLEQMQRSDTARVDYATAREIAQRSGAKAVVTGSIVPAGTGYIVTARLVEAQSGNDLAMYTESARDAGDLIPAVDRLTKALRRKIGESLKSVHDAPRLDRVTTASLGALKSYAAGIHANDIQGDYPAAIQHFRDAIRQDSAFAMAWVQLSYSLASQGGPGSTARSNAALTEGFRFRDRLPERERYNVEGAYYWLVAIDRKRAIPAIQRAVELDSTNVDAANNLAILLTDTRDYPAAERMSFLALASEPENGTLLTNLANLYTTMGRHASFDSLMDAMERDSIPFPTGPSRYTEFLARKDFDAAERLARASADTARPRQRVNAQEGVVYMLVLRGRLREAEQLFPQWVDARLRVRGDTVSPYRKAYFRAMVDGDLRGNTARARAMLDSTLRNHPPGVEPIEIDQSLFLALAFSVLGDAAKTRQVMAQRIARMDTLGQRQFYVFLTRVRGMIALGEGKYDSAVTYFRQGDFEADGLPTSSGTVWTPFLIGIAFDKGGHADSARKYLTEYVEMAGNGRNQMDPFNLAPSMFRLGQLYQDAGDTTRAMDYYSRFVDLWKKADPELQPRVAEARRAMAELVPDRRR
jgi:tetratricopeptide (TPR) repeat protein